MDSAEQIINKSLRWWRVSLKRILNDSITGIMVHAELTMISVSVDGKELQSWNPLNR